MNSYSAWQLFVGMAHVHKELSRTANFARYTGQYGSYVPSSPLGFINPW